MNEKITLFEKRFDPDAFGVVRLNLYPEGLSLWIGGTCRYLSSRDPELMSELANAFAKKAKTKEELRDAEIRQCWINEGGDGGE